MWVYPPNCRTKVGARWSPSFPRQSLARRRARNIVQVHAHALNGSWECYHVVRIGLGAIWGDHGWRRSLHFTTPHFVWKWGGYTHFCPFPKNQWHQLCCDIFPIHIILRIRAVVHSVGSPRTSRSDRALFLRGIEEPHVIRGMSYTGTRYFGIHCRY